MLTPKYTDLSEGLYFNLDPFKAIWSSVVLVPVYSFNCLTRLGVVLAVQITVRTIFIPPGSLMIHSTITNRITICIFIFGREGSTNIVWKRIYAWTCKFTYKTKKKQKQKKKQWVGYSVRDGWAFGPSFWLYSFWFNLRYHSLFSRWGESGSNRSHVASSIHTGIRFLNSAPEKWKQQVEEMKSQYSREATVELGVTFTRRLKRTLESSRLDIFVIKQSNTFAWGLVKSQNSTNLTRTQLPSYL